MVHNFVRNVFGGVASPTFGGIKCDDTHRFIELPFGDLSNDVPAARFYFVGFPVNRARFEFIDDKIVSKLKSGARLGVWRLMQRTPTQLTANKRARYVRSATVQR